MISIEEGLDLVLARAAATVGADRMPVETVTLEESLGRVLRQEVLSDADSPPFDRSIRDGFALRAADVERVPAELQIVGESRAGKSFDGHVGAGQCCQIMTGAEVPPGCDAVVMVEDTTSGSDGRVVIRKSVESGRSIQPRGSECLAGDRLLAPGRWIGVSETGLLASAGLDTVGVSRRPSVAIVSTGDELVEIDQVPGPAEIRNSNSFTLRSQVLEAGGAPTILGIARDDREDLAAKVAAGLEHDILITSGGVSMGKYDLVVEVLESLGVEIGFDRVAMKPGKPTVFGWTASAFVFGLPGNPVSTIVSFQLFVRPLIRTLLQATQAGRAPLEATLSEPLRCDPARAACVPARVGFADGVYQLSPVPWKGSSDLIGLSRANAYVLVPKQEGQLEAGSRVRFIPLEVD
jgi:molybdopterin molybdotransferase